MLIVTFHNISPVGTEVCDYDVEVLVTTTPTTTKHIWSGAITNHRREDGWRALIKRLADIGYLSPLT